MYYYQRRHRAYVKKYGHLRRPLEVARSHPEYGYRRAAVELRATWGHRFNHKVVQRLHRLWDLPLLRGTRRRRPIGIQQAVTLAGRRANLVGDRPTARHMRWSTRAPPNCAMAVGHKGHLVTLVDHATKVVVGWAIDNRKTTEVAVQAWERAKTDAGHVRGESARNDRASLRYRAALAKLQTMIKNRIHAILLNHGYQCPHSDAFGVKGRAWLTTLDLRSVYY